MMRLLRLECNYSSWSLRAYLMLCQTGQDFEEQAVPMQGDFRDFLRQHTPCGKVPTLTVDGITLWESLAIGEFLHERFPHCGLYPQDWRQRALARCLAHEMHSGFLALRAECPMDIRSRHSHRLSVPGQFDLDRIGAIWRQQLGSGGPFLFGEWSLADAMFAPVVTRIRSYGLPVAPECQGYCERVLNHPWMRAWCERAECETTEVTPGLSGPQAIRPRVNPIGPS